MKIKVTKPGIYGAKGMIPVGTEFDVKEEPKGWAGRYAVVSGGGKGKTAVTNPAEGAQPAYEAAHRGGGSYSIMKGDAEVVEKLSKEDAEAFNAMGEAEKAEYVEASKKG